MTINKNGTEKPGLRIAGTGAFLPKKCVLSSDIDNMLGWPAGTTENRFDLTARYVAEGDETSSYMAEQAALQALDAAGIAPQDLDLILGACGVMEQVIPSTATLVQHRLGLGKSGIPAYDVNATCLSFIQALDLAAMKIQLGLARNVLIFSADIASVGLDWKEPNVAAIFGDGAAAVVLTADGDGLLASRFETYSEGRDACVLAGGGTRISAAVDPVAAAEASYFRMNGQAAFRVTARYLSRFLKRLFAQDGLNIADIDCIIPHQASGLSLTHGLARVGLDPDKVIQTFSRFGNQIATSIPMALHTAICEKRLQRNDLVLLAGTSAGISIGGVVLRY
ncbi:beta-ketoacyl-ACP synthase III [Bacillus subtilis]|uniref:3-oxoacyl-[acyl-carrier-protein] synthase III C-terminal domain-containing protein n=1 Tax=Pseudochrobactrum asaccharolyticum TaxID=354351 RepID=UPI001F2D45DB|nr:3-oxoacyl-[acyl-carrier-protein] synthase III C-terminal domain-containing protein [Pseudochrobactrum asaccharolyticum]MCF7645272.1 ketoacyl-ACP synthase III [Pseudochrobactrum asaccharolyticum]MCF7671884.1 beta-ketoacyl-ACP synthase III [Bacillus subtilis]